MNRVYCNFITPTIRQQAHRLGINPSILNNIISTMKSVNNNPNIDTSDNAINTFINNNKDKIKEIKLSLPYYKSIPLSTNYNKLTSTIMGSITIRTFNDNFPSSDWINHTYKSEFMLNNLDLFDSPRAIYTYELYLEKLCIENNVDLSKLSSTERNKYIDSAIKALKEVKETYPDEFEVKSNTINIKDGNSNVNVEYKIVSNIKGSKFATIKDNTVSIREAVSTNEIRHYLAGDTDEFRKKVMQNLKNRGYNTSSIYEAMGDKNNIAKFLISSMYSHLKNNDAATYNKLDENGKLDIETRATEDGLNSIGIYPKTISTPVRSTNIADYVNTEGEDKGFLTKKGEELLSTTFDKNKFNKGTFSVALYPGPAGTILSIGFISPKGNKFYVEYSSSPTRKTWDLSNSKQQNITDVTSEKYWNIINTIVPKSLRDLVDSGKYYKMDTTDTEKGGEASLIKRSELEEYFEKEYNVFMQGRSLDYNTKQINKALSPVQENSNEEQSIIDKAKKNGIFMKAPNGKPTNLTEKQWVQVRTKAFKEWFGDWEEEVRRKNRLEVIKPYIKNVVPIKKILPFIDSGLVNAENTPKNKLYIILTDFFNSLPIPKELNVYYLDSKIRKDLPYCKNWTGYTSNDNTGFYIIDDSNKYQYNKIDSINSNISTFIHELTHALLMKSIEENKEFRNKVQNLYDYTIQYLKNTNTYDRYKDMYSFTDIHEFISDAVSNISFMRVLDDIPSPNKEKNSIFDDFLNAIKTLFKELRGGFAGKKHSILDDIFNLFNTDNFNIYEHNNVSKVVDENGEPLVVYHTRDAYKGSDFSVFNTNIENRESAIYTTDSKDMSLSYWKFGKDREILSELFFYIGNDISKIDEDPFTGEAILNSQYQKLIKILKELGITNIKDSYTKEELNDIYNNLKQKEKEKDIKDLFINLKNPIIIEGNNSQWNDINYQNKTVSTRDIEDMYRNSNYDGVIFKNIKDWGDMTEDGDSANVFAVYKPNQVKSAINNTGVFSKYSNDIYDTDSKVSIPVQDSNKDITIKGINFITIPSKNYADRTKANAEWSDITMALAEDFNTAGEKLTKTVAGNKYVSANISNDVSTIVNNIYNQLISKGKIKDIKLNIAGNGIYSLKDTQSQYDTKLIDIIKGLQAKGVTISEIRSGGQTGIDEAGAKAGQFLNIKTTITSTSDFKFRNKQGVDINNEQAFKARFASTNKYVNHYTGNIVNDGNTIFVFGSNPEGRHGAGAAKVAREQFGAKYGVGEGITGNSYALPTKDLRVKVNNSFRSISPKDIINNIRKLYETAKSIPSKQFKVAYRNGINERTLNGYTGEELVSFFKAAGELPKNIQISEEWSKYWNDVQPYDVTKDTVEISGPVTIDISKEDNDNTPMIGEQGNLVLDIESPYVRMSRVFTATELTDRTNDIAREFSSQLDSLYEDLLDEYENRIAEASTTEDKRKLEQDLALLKEDNGRKIAINKIGFSVIVDNIKASYSDVLNYDDETIREIYNTDPNIIRTKIQNTLDYFEYLLEDACNIIEMNEVIRITIDKHMFNDGTKNSEIIDGGIADTEQETNDEDEQIGDNENGEAVSGNDGWSFKVREVSPHDSISKGTKSVLRDIKKIRPDGSVDVDDLGKVRYVREDIAHATLINALSDMIDPDDFSKLENGNYRLLALERVAQKYPWVNQVIDKLLEEPRLISLFYTDFRKDFISYWTQKYNKDKGLIENIPLNQSVAIDSTITDVIRNYENKDMMSEDSIYDSNGKIVKENADKGINNVDKAFKLIKTLDEDELDNIYKYINDSLRMVGFNTKVNDVSYLYDNVNGRNNLITLVRNLREIFEKVKDLGENEHLIDSLKEQYKNLAELVGTVTELDNIQSFRVNGKSYYSYSAPNYVNTQIKTFLNDAKRQNYLDTEFKAYDWFYNKDNKTWKNEWLRQIESDADVRNHIAIKEINVLDKDSYNDWKPNQIKEAFLEEYLSIPENKGSKKQYAWYNFPIFSDSPVAMFIRFTKYIDDNEGTFKQKLLPLFRQIVYQEMDRIKLCENRDKSGVMKIQNFDKRGKIFNFFPELNTNKYGKSQISFKEAIQYYADDKEGLDRFIDMAINEIMDKNFKEFLKSYNNDDLLIQVKRTGVVTTDEAALNKLEEYFWNQSFATSQIIQITTTDLAYYKDGVDFQKRFKEIYAAGSKLNTNSKYGRKIERTIYLKDNIITSANYTDIKSNIMQAVKEKRLSKEEGLAILDKFKDINQTDAQAYRSLSSYRAVLDMMGLWTDDMQRAFDNLQKGIYDSRDFDIVWQTIKPFVFTQIDKNDGLGGHIKVPHQNKNSEFLLLAAYDILNSVMSKSPKFVGLNRFMEDKGIDVIQFESAVKAGGEGIVDISVSQNKVNKVVRDQAITLGNITIPLEGVKDWKTIKKAFDDALDNNNISQDDYNTVMKYFEPTSDEVYEMLNNAACKPVLDTDIIEDGYNTSVVHSIPYKDYVVQTPTPEHLFDASSIYGSQYRNLILSDIPDNMEITINGKTFKGKEIKDFYNSLIIENLLEDFRNIRGYFDSIQDLQKELLSMVKGNPKYGRDMLNALQIVKRNINGVEREVFNLPLHNPSTTTKIQELVNSIFKNHITKQKIKGGKATLASNFGFTRDLKILREEDGSIIGAECYLPFYSKKYFEPILVDVKDKEGNIIGQKLDINRLDPELRKLLGFRIPTENLYSMLPMIIKGFLPQQNGSSIMLPADITQIAGEDFDVDGRFLFLPESKLEWYDYKRAFRDYKNSHSVDNNGNIALADKNGVLSSLLEELGGKEQLTDSEVSFTEWFKINKDDYKLDKPKLKKIRYNINKAPKDNSRAARNNMLIDLGYSILSAKESAERINSPGNFDKAKAEARRADILKDNELVNTYMEINSITKLSEVGPRLLKESLDSLNDFMSKYKKERNPLSVDTFIYNHHQNTTGGKLIGIYANNNTAHAKFQSTRLGIAEANQFKIDGTIFSSLSSKTTNINGINESILSNCAQLSAASVDNVKVPVLASLLQNENTASIGGTMLAMGMSLKQMGLLFTQPIVRKYIESDLNNLKFLENEINGLCKNYHIVLEDLKNDTTSEELVNNILYYNRLDWDKITPENIQDYSVEDKKASDILKDVVIATYKWYNIALIARDYSDLIRISRADSPNGAMKRNIAQTTNQLHNVDRFLVNSFKVGFTLTNTEDCIRNNVVKLTDTEEEMRTKLNKRPMSMLQAFHSLGIDLGSSLESKVFMQLSDNVKTMVNILYNNSAYNTISDKLLDNFYSDLTKFALSKTKMFGNDGTRTFDEKRDYYLYKFPKKFLEFKLNPKNKEITNLGIIKKLSVKRGKIIMDNSGKITGALREMFMRDFEKLLYMDNPDARQFATDLLAYSFYLDGLNFGPNSYGNFFSTVFLNSYPELVNALSAMETDINSNMYADYLNQFYANYWKEEGLLPTYKTDTQNQPAKSVDGSILIPKKICANSNVIDETYYPLIKLEVTNKLTGESETTLYSYDENFDSEKSKRYYPVKVHNPNQGVKYNANMTAVEMADIETDENLIKENRELDINNIELVGQTLEDETGNNPKEDTPIPVDDSISVLSSDLAEQLGDLADIQSDMADFINQGRNDSGIINC